MPEPPVAPAPPLVPPALPTPTNNLTAAIPALLIGLIGALSTWQSHQDSRDTTKVSYDTLKAASELQAREIATLRQSVEAQRVAHEETRSWIAELSARLEQRQTAAEKVLRKVKPAAQTVPSVARALPPPTPLPEPPPPPAAPPPPAPAPSPLPSFESLTK